MEITTDVTLKGPIWAETLDTLRGTFFDTFWDIYALCISIGMMYDRQIETEDMIPEGYTEEPRYIPRNVLINPKRASLLEFMYQTAMVTTKNLDFGEKERLELAFLEEKKQKQNPLPLLTKFANYGVTLLHPLISDTSDTETMESIAAFLNTAYEEGIAAISEYEDLEDIE